MPVIGVDLGGTRIRVGAVDPGGEVTALRQLPTQAERPAREIALDIAVLARAVETETGSASGAIGVGVPTTIDAAGRLAPCANLPTFGRYPLAEELGRLLGRAVQLENDARCFALGEWLRGAARGTGIAAGLTLGTSVGLGIVIDGTLVKGAHGEAGEIWRSAVDLRAGQDAGDLNELLRGLAIAEAWNQATGADLDPSDVARLARGGDPAARGVLAGYGERLGAALCWICDLLDPDIVVIGGAVAASFDLFREPARRALGARRTILASSALGDRAAILGAAGIAGWRGEEKI